jgi:hypothetical protein
MGKFAEQDWPEKGTSNGNQQNSINKQECANRSRIRTFWYTSTKRLYLNLS